MKTDIANANTPSQNIQYIKAIKRKNNNANNIFNNLLKVNTDILTYFKIK